MMLKRNLEKNKKFVLYIISLFCALALIFVSAQVSYAKFISNTLNTYNSARVAQYVLELTETDGVTNETSLYYKSNLYEYFFSVKNYNDTKASEVVVDYVITIVPTENYIADGYVLYRVNADDSRTQVGLDNSHTSEIELGTQVTDGSNVSVTEEIQNYVLVYKPVSTTANATAERLFTISVVASQR